MSESLPSGEIHAIDIPEVKGFRTRFQYNFFVPDESVNETTRVPKNIIERPVDDRGTSFVQYATSRVPRMVIIEYSKPELKDIGRDTTQGQVANASFGGGRNPNLIKANIDKIISEEQLSSDTFVGMNFHDGAIDQNLYILMSGTLVHQSIAKYDNTEATQYQSAMRLASFTPSFVKPEFVYRSFIQPVHNVGRLARNDDGTQPKDPFMDGLKKVHVTTQINGRYFADLVKQSIDNPYTLNGPELGQSQDVAKTVESLVETSFNGIISNDDFKTFIPYVDITVTPVGTTIEREPAKIVGYVIEKNEIMKDGSVRPLAPIVIENPDVLSTVDLKVKYNSRYSYTIRTIVQFKVPAIDQDTGELAMLTVLVGSRQSHVEYVSCVENVPPPEPADVSFTWDYERVNPNTGTPGSLMIHWSFPVNSQRDIKKFQVFRRTSAANPFELVKVYDFDDSVVRNIELENPDPDLIEYHTFPITHYYDDRFKRSSKVIYAIASVDAHGRSSNYSAQFQITFDRFKNRINKKLISHKGAPKSYPNLYREIDMFVDTIRVSGEHSKTMSLFFNPEYYSIYNDEEKFETAFQTIQQGGKYRLQVINTDNQKQQVIEVTIDDPAGRVTRHEKLPDPVYEIEEDDLPYPGYNAPLDDELT